MNLLERMKLVKSLDKAANERNAENNPLKKMGLVKQVAALRKQLGMVKGGENTPTRDTKEIDINSLDTDLYKYIKETDKGLFKAVERWLKANVQKKTLTTVDGKKVTFNREQSVDHLTFNSRRSELAAKSIPFVVSVFTKGEFKGVFPLTHERKKDTFFQFHVYQKWVEIGGYRLLLETHAGEREDNSLEVMGSLVGYNQKIIEKQQGSSLLGSSDAIQDSADAGRYASLENNTTLILDNVQENEDNLITILEITDLNATQSLSKTTHKVRSILKIYSTTTPKVSRSDNAKTTIMPRLRLCAKYNRENWRLMILRLNKKSCFPLILVRVAV